MIIIVRQSTGAYLARAKGMGTTASCAESPLCAAKRVAAKLDRNPELLEQVSHDQGQGVYAFQLREAQPV